MVAEEAAEIEAVEHAEALLEHVVPRHAEERGDRDLREDDEPPLSGSLFSQSSVVALALVFVSLPRCTSRLAISGHTILLGPELALQCHALPVGERLRRVGERRIRLEAVPAGPDRPLETLHQCLRVPVDVDVVPLPRYPLVQPGGRLYVADEAAPFGVLPEYELDGTAVQLRRRGAEKTVRGVLARLPVRPRWIIEGVTQEGATILFGRFDCLPLVERVLSGKRDPSARAELGHPACVVLEPRMIRQMSSQQRERVLVEPTEHVEPVLVRAQPVLFDARGRQLASEAGSFLIQRDPHGRRALRIRQLEGRGQSRHAATHNGNLLHIALR